MKYRMGKMYAVKFQDHAINGSAIMCITSGTVVREDKTTVTLAFWLPVSKDKELVKDNWEIVTIVKSTVVKSIEIDF